MTITSHESLRIFYFVLTLATTLSWGNTHLHGQQFNYSLQQDSVNWQPLSSLTLLNMVNSPWESTYKVPIGFTFPFLGQNFDSIIIASNGTLYFDDAKRYSMMTYTTVGNIQDSTGNWSVLGYSINGDSGSRVLTIEFINVGLQTNSAFNLSYQVSIHENGEIRIIAGAISPSFQEIALMHYCVIGIVNEQMDTPVSGLFVSNDSNTYQLNQITEQNPGIPQLITLPVTGTRFRFIPNP